MNDYLRSYVPESLGQFGQRLMERLEVDSTVGHLQTIVESKTDFLGGRPFHGFPPVHRIDAPDRGGIQPFRFRSMWNSFIVYHLNGVSHPFILLSQVRYDSRPPWNCLPNQRR